MAGPIISHYLHVKTYEDAFRQVKLEFPNIYDDPDFIWNMDETSVDAEFGGRKRVYSNADTHYGEYSTVTVGTGGERHVTVVIACSASGKKALSFFIIYGKRNMSNWYLGLDEDVKLWVRTTVVSGAGREPAGDQWRYRHKDSFREPGSSPLSL